MTKRGRFMTYGSAVALIVVGGACAAFVAGVMGQVLAMGLIGSGLVILTGLVFMEVGLSEDRERDKELADRAPAPAGRAPAPAGRAPAGRAPAGRAPAGRAPTRRRLEPPRPPRLRGPRHER